MSQPAPDHADSRDVALARALQAQGVDVPTLQALLAQARSRRGQGDQFVSLAGLVRERQLVSEAALRQAGALPAAGAATVAARPPGSDRQGGRPPTAAELAPTQLGSPAPSAPSSTAGSAPTKLGAYNVLRELARGGMGVVYEVEHESTGARYALKALLLAGLAPGSQAATELRLRQQREAESLAKLDHPNVVPVRSADLTGPRPYLVQDLMPGGSLEDRLRSQGPLPLDEAVWIGRELAEGLSHTHERGLLHRDLKPDNVLFDDQGRARLADFGLALPADEQQRLTMSGQILGTPGYMSPEQAEGKLSDDPRLDVYGLGAVIYAMISGQQPFTGASALATLQAIRERPPAPLRSLRSEVPPEVEAVVLKALAKRPEQRHATALELGQALEQAWASSPAAAQADSRTSSRSQTGQPAESSRQSTLTISVVAALAVVLAGVGGLLVLQGREEGEPSDPSPSEAPLELRPPVSLAEPKPEPTVPPGEFDLRWDLPPERRRYRFSFDWDNARLPWVNGNYTLEFELERTAPQDSDEEEPRIRLRGRVLRMTTGMPGRMEFEGRHDQTFTRRIMSAGQVAEEGPVRREENPSMLALFRGVFDPKSAVELEIDPRTGGFTGFSGVTEALERGIELVELDEEQANRARANAMVGDRNFQNGFDLLTRVLPPARRERTSEWGYTVEFLQQAYACDGRRTCWLESPPESGSPFPDEVVILFEDVQTSDWVDGASGDKLEKDPGVGKQKQSGKAVWRSLGPGRVDLQKVSYTLAVMDAAALDKTQPTRATWTLELLATD